MIFLIWSQKHKAWWRPNGMGYTKHRDEAGKYSYEDLQRQTLDGCDKDVPRRADVLVIYKDPHCYRSVVVSEVKFG